MTRWLWCLAAQLLVPAVAGATYSICATDMAARQVGGTGTSCIAPSSVYIIYGTAPGHGVVHAQAQYNEMAKLEAVDRLNLDEAPADIITAITAPAFDPLALLRQYGIADLMGRTAGFTGAGTMAYAEDRQGLVDTFPYSVQGNILTSVAVINQAEDAFVNGGGCDLADRLMLALEAGANGGEGDSRCTPDGIPSDAAFIEVDREGEAAQSFLYLEVSNTAPLSPIPLLRQQYDTWRMTHPCPAMPDGGMPEAAIDGAAVPDAGTAADAPADVVLDMATPLDGPPVDAARLDVGAADGSVDAALQPDGPIPDATPDRGGDEARDAQAISDAPSVDARPPDAPADAAGDAGAAGAAGDASGGCACRASSARGGSGAWAVALAACALARPRPRRAVRSSRS